MELIVVGLDIAKTGGAKLILLSQETHVAGQVIFTSGYLDLNGQGLYLDATGEFVGESENSRIIIADYGNVFYDLLEYTTKPGSSIGFSFSSNPDNVSCRVRRGHIAWTGNLGTGSGIKRWFQISQIFSSPPNPTISIRMKYFESELNGLNENDLVFWSTYDGINWRNDGYTTRNTTDNYLELSSVTDFDWRFYTLAPAGSSRPTTSAPQQIKTIAVPGKETIINKWKTWPNPADKILWIDITSASASQATTSIFDSKGSLIRIQTNHLMEGSNKLRMDLKSLAAGIYYITTTWDAGKQKRSSSFVKL